MSAHGHCARAISAYGGILAKVAPTQNIDRLVKEGMLFENCFVTDSICTPRRATLFNGKYWSRDLRNVAFNGQSFYHRRRPRRSVGGKGLFLVREGLVMRIKSCHRGPFLDVTLALVYIVVCSGRCPTAEAGRRLEIPAWSFDRGNGRVVANPDTYADYRDMHPELVVVGGDRLPWEVQYDVDVPIDATYTLKIRYGSPEPRPIELWLDGRKVATCCGRVTGDSPPYLDRWPRHDLPRQVNGFHGVEWEEACTLPIARGKHTFKLTRAGPPPRMSALRLESSADFPGDWKPTGPSVTPHEGGEGGLMSHDRYGPRARYDQAFGQPHPEMKIDRIPPRYRSAFLPPGSVNVATLRMAIENVIAEFGPEYPKGPQYLKQLAELEAKQAAVAGGAPEQKKPVEDVLKGLRRQVMLDHPLMKIDKLLFVKRMNDSRGRIYRYFRCSPGGGLCILSAAGGNIGSPDAKVTEIAPQLAGGIFGRFDLSYNAKKVVFSYFKEPYPLSEKLFLVSHNPNKNSHEPTGHALYVLDAWGNRTELYRDPDISCFQPIPLRLRRKPTEIPSVADMNAKAGNADEAKEEKLATLFMQDVYRGMTGIERGRVKYLRVMEARALHQSEGGMVRINLQVAAVSLGGDVHLKKVHGIVPVYEDGSACFIAPARTNLYFQALDENYMELQRMRSFVNLMPGEKRSCIGCHELRRNAPGAGTGHPLALKHGPAAILPQPGDTGPRMVHYATDVQPILDKHCIGCHGGPEPKGDLVLSGEATSLWNLSYENLVNKDLVSFLYGCYGEANIPAELPLTFGSHQSKLVERIRKDPCKGELTREEFIKIVTWIDANAPYYGTHRGKKTLESKDDPQFRPVPLAGK